MNISKKAIMSFLMALTSLVAMAQPYYHVMKQGDNRCVLIRHLLRHMEWMEYIRDAGLVSLSFVRLEAKLHGFFRLGRIDHFAITSNIRNSNLDYSFSIKFKLRRDILLH